VADSFHKTYNIAPGTYRIDENGIANAYLLLGEKKALLIDSGDGVGNIRESVEEITKLPVTVALTHLHCDHAGGVNWFDSYCYHRSDNKGIYYLEASTWAAKKLAKMSGKSLTFSKKPHKAKKMLFDDNVIFDLGGRIVRIMNTPGHTLGSTVFIDEKEHLMFTGDEVNYWLWLQLPGCTSVEKWLPNAKQILSLADRFTFYCGHNDGLLTKAMVQELVERGEELVNGAKGIKVSRGVYAYPDNQWKEHSVIWYHKVK
jgi:hydroxyacylglutathione hydrolase